MINEHEAWMRGEMTDVDEVAMERASDAADLAAEAHEALAILRARNGGDYDE